MKIIVPVLAAAAIALASGTAMAQRTDVVIGVVLEPPHLDPTASAAAAIDEIVYANVFEGLTRIGRTGEVLPALASSWEISDDGLTYTFPLQEGVTFHDGAELTSSDVKFSLDRARAEDSTNAQKGLFAAIRSTLAENGVAYALEPVHRDFRPGDVRHSLADVSASREQLGYAPTHDLGAGLAHLRLSGHWPVDRLIYLAKVTVNRWTGRTR